MEPVTIIASALSLSLPFIIKAGEGFTNKIGEDVWEWIKKPFTKPEQDALFKDLDKPENIEKIKKELLQKVGTDSKYLMGLQKIVEEYQNKYNQQNITNHKKIEKQINIQDNKGPIQM